MLAEHGKGLVGRQTALKRGSERWRSGGGCRGWCQQCQRKHRDGNENEQQNAMGNPGAPFAFDIIGHCQKDRKNLSGNIIHGQSPIGYRNQRSWLTKCRKAPC
ncbi:hypothetical protein XAP6164_1490007 [Xanthomonas phaseoli pv. phaseoli]|uniref:Uncharacterized protein n=1 Tax=Xanthomonas campestris pv. phaseoli TaxID=317013 RepID=A0AB38DZD1_XANCH|nr:hypothetical protein XAP7430_320060 [Xanthomonas phaseoli pv. phaseoli]SOO27288.1 hypothetical protein XAP6164_1490007 [Xanthomonas phaseoli pv. phaseoli]